jgi:hypothetical protein
MHESERIELPAAGARARQWRRFEDGLRSWLDTPQGRFVAWDAQRRIEAGALAVAPAARD